MLPEEIENIYQEKLTQLGIYIQTDNPENAANQLKTSNLIPEIKKLLDEYKIIDMADAYGNTLLHYVASSEGFDILAQQERKAGNFTHVLDIPAIVMSYKPNPLMKDASGFTPSFLAAYYNNEKAYRFLQSYENSYTAGKISRAIQALSAMQQEAEYVSNRGYRICVSSQQTPAYFQNRRGVLKIMNDLQGKPHTNS